ncbi:helix-turn-helix domain-containing protein [Maritalea porphyrae]|jgi:DNA-binding HxlR family transcriptional regulator|uniref:winged helix-turn-helix transcriptional regulator n=1 Tax=Maritalea porphyrae TaxID=880732 RepID=UPI0022AF322F|nr:helix-turn-helix domain-containing protein [Maritalea porphyrae]MCZ4273946.1 helix-turn-helix domain-containing protein [Maritalea porphyrae]
MSQNSYNQFCPIAMACEILEPRWTLLIMCEMWSGSMRFNEIRRGVPRMSPTLLSKRLKEMEVHGLISRREDGVTGGITYKITPVGNELGPIVHALGQWAHRNVDTEVTLEHLDARLLMWNIRRKVDRHALPMHQKTTIQFMFPELENEQTNYWLIAKPGCDVDICWNDPGFNVDLFVSAELKAMTSAWLGLSRLEKEIDDQKIDLIGDEHLASTIGNWLVRSSLASC